MKRKREGIRTIVVAIVAVALFCTMIVPALAASYDGEVAANYAYTNAKNYVPGTSVFKTNGDCTNFVSHSLQAGGWGEIGGWYTSNNVWFYNFPYRYGYSHTWAVVDRFYDFLTYGGRAYPVSVKYNKHLLQKGDIVQIDYKDQNGNYGSWDHTMIVTDKNGNNPSARFLGWRLYSSY